MQILEDDGPRTSPRYSSSANWHECEIGGAEGTVMAFRHFEPSTSAVSLRLRVSPALRKIVIPHGQQTRCMPKASGALNGVVLSSSLARCRHAAYGPTG